mgnify:CR=1 FL=1
MSTLLIAEKKKAAKAIAKALGKPKIIKKAKNLEIYHLSNLNLYVIPLRGHILEYQNTDQYKSWSKSNPRDIITDPQSIKKVPIKYAYPYIKVLKEFASKAKKVIIGTDADIEGCNIGLCDALPLIRKKNRNIQIEQLWLSSLQRREIVAKYQSLVKPKWNWAKTGEARAIIDAIIGFSATREVTNTLKPVLKEFKRIFVSIGRVQTSLLYLIYLKEQEIEQFVPKSYWNLKAILDLGDPLIKAYHTSNPFEKKDETKVKTIFHKIQQSKHALVVQKRTNTVQRKPPTPLNTSKALVLLTKNLRISANTALKTMNALYLNQIITYPRTESDIYKPDFEHAEIIKKFASHSIYGKFSSKFVQTKQFRPTKGKSDAGDHPPITPLRSLESSSSQLKGKTQKRVYDLLARHYLALFGENAVEINKQLDLTIEQEPFKARITALQSPGFLDIVPFLKKRYTAPLEILENQIPLKEILLEDKETRPPPRYTDTTLLRLMENNHLGTKSTRPGIIEILIKRNLIYAVKRQYHLAPLGDFLIKELMKVWLAFLKPDFTKFVEQELEKIQKNQAEMKEVVKKIKNVFLQLFDKFLSSKKKIQQDMKNFLEDRENSFQKQTIKKFPVKNVYCPNCKRQILDCVIKSDKTRSLICPDKDCELQLSIPKSGYFKALDSKCSICGFNIFSFRRKKRGKVYTYFICPYCWNEDSEVNPKRTFCSECKKYKIEKNKCVER